jgi:hypothetical protein
MMLLVQRVIKNEKSSKVSNATLRQTNIAIGHPFKWRLNEKIIYVMGHMLL